MKTKEQIIEEAIKEWKEQDFYVGFIYDDEEYLRKVACRKAQELSGPVSSPSDLIVEVDGEKRGNYPSFNRADISKEGELPKQETFVGYETLQGKGFGRAPMSKFHIRLLTPEGGVWMDNKLNHKREDK